MGDRELERRAEIARKLKAARWLAGTFTGGRKPKPAAITPEQLAKRKPLPEDGITASLIGSIERMERPSRPMELEAIARALGQPPGYFRAPGDGGDQAVLDEAHLLIQALQRRREAPGEDQSRPGAENG